ncbi:MULTISPECIES: hypothetical protein [Methylobacterium]|uniref:hypothetical protein n=1 Tax=Methylobacterium TaxID=407 RepID=UPI00272EE476|nr:hypothetical protein [Methylobacterium sp.]
MDDPRKRRSPSSLLARSAMVNAIAPVVSRMTTEQVRQALGDSQGNVGQLRRDLSDIKSRCPDRLRRLGFERLFWMCDRLGLNPILAMQGPVVPKVEAVH